MIITIVAVIAAVMLLIVSIVLSIGVIVIGLRVTRSKDQGE